jgi:KDO2-lipid IV(A) lauroyltransferase
MLFRMPGSRVEGVLERVSFKGLDDLKAVARAGHGAIILTGHLGNWEMAGAAIAASGIDLDAVARGMANRRFEADLFEVREQLGIGLIDRDQALKGVLRSLRRGRVVAILGDQNASDGGVFVPFFGELAATARGPALFALRTGAPLFVGILVREPGWRQRYTAELRRVEVPPTGNLEADVRTLVVEYTRELERAIRRVPEQYFWHHRRWKTRPPAEP